MKTEKFHSFYRVDWRKITPSSAVGLGKAEVGEPLHQHIPIVRQVRRGLHASALRVFRNRNQRRPVETMRGYSMRKKCKIGDIVKVNYWPSPDQRGKLLRVLPPRDQHGVLNHQVEAQNFLAVPVDEESTTIPLQWNGENIWWYSYTSVIEILPPPSPSVRLKGKIIGKRQFQW